MLVFGRSVSTLILKCSTSFKSKIALSVLGNNTRMRGIAALVLVFLILWVFSRWKPLLISTYAFRNSSEDNVERLLLRELICVVGIYFCLSSTRINLRKSSEEAGLTFIPSVIDSALI